MPFSILKKNLGEDTQAWASGWTSCRSFQSATSSFRFRSARCRWDRKGSLAIAHQSRLRSPKISPNVRQFEEATKKPVHALLLNLCPGLPAREGGFGDCEQVRQGLLGESEGLSMFSDLGGGQQTRRGSKTVGQPVFRIVVENDRRALLARENSAVIERDFVLSAVVFELRRIGGKYNLFHGPLVARCTLPRESVRRNRFLGTSGWELTRTTIGHSSSSSFFDIFESGNLPAAPIRPIGKIYPESITLFFR